MLIQTSVVEQYFLGFVADGTHCLHGLYGVCANACFRAEHYDIGTIEYGVGNIAGFSACGASVVDHRLQHLRRRYNRLCGGIAQANDALLDNRHGGGRDLNTKVTAGHHDGIRGVNDTIKICQCFRLLNLGDEPLRPAVFLDVLSERFNIGGRGLKIDDPRNLARHPILVVTGDHDPRHPRAVDVDLH